MQESKERILESLIAFVKEERDSYQSVLDTLERSLDTRTNGEPKPLPAKAHKKNRPKQTRGEGIIKFSKFLLEVMRNNPGRNYDIMDLIELANNAIEAGEIVKPAGTLKDEISKRLWQFVKRGDVIKKDSGYIISPYKS